MFYNQYPYNVFNQNYYIDYIGQQQGLMQAEQQHHNEQQQNIIELRKAISDYFRTAKKVTQDYQQEAVKACFDEILKQAVLDGIDL